MVTSPRWRAVAAKGTLCAAARCGSSPVLALAVSRAQEPDDERVDDPRGAPAVREALGERLAACVDAGGFSRCPRRGPGAVIGDVAVALGVGGEPVARADLAPPTAPATPAPPGCGASGEALVASLGPAGMAPTTAPWAEGLARAPLAGRVLTCATAERDGATLDPDDRAALTAFEQQLARALSGLAAAGTCAVNENLLPSCAASVSATGCEGLGARVDEDPAVLARTLTPACQAMIRCGAALLDDGGADDDPDAAALDAP
ncbi:MAG: hypothetical protein U0325_30905 [Polyangiales bacterium]